MFFGFEFVVYWCDCFGRGVDLDDFGFVDLMGEVGVFWKKVVVWMNCVGIVVLCGGKDFGCVEVVFGCCCVVESDGFVGVMYEGCFGVVFGVDCYVCDVYVVCGVYYVVCDFFVIGDEEFGDGFYCCFFIFVIWCSCGCFWWICCGR